MDVETTNVRIPAEDDLLADFLDWCDRRRVDGAMVGISERDLIDSFVAEQVDSKKAASHRPLLQQFLRDSEPIAQLAANAVSAWLGEERLTDGSALHEEVLPRSFGEYELLQRIGQGGMGVVYKARQASLDRVIALKMLPPGLLQQDRIHRLSEEARLAGAMNHPGIVAVFDADEYEGQPFYVMELVEGETLAERLARHPLSELEAVRSIDEIAEAIEYAHAHGVLHRDLKPSNVLTDSNGRLRVTDFGLAKRVDGSITRESVSGTPSYMSPEQAMGGAVDQRADVYGLGAVLYELLSGRPPHLGDSPLKTLHLVTTEEPVDLCRLRPGLSRDLETVCHKCLAKKPLNRYASVVELREEFARIRRNEPVHARPIGPMQRMLRWARRNRTIAVTGLVTAVSLALLTSIGAYALHITNVSLGRAQSAERRKGEALSRATDAEKEQRHLAEALRWAKNRSDEALYRSQIARVAQLRSSGDVLSARRLFQQLRPTGTESGVEYALLKRMLYPEEMTLPDTSIIDIAWNCDGQSFYTVTSDGRIARWTSDGEKTDEIQDQSFPQLIAIHPSGNQIATVDSEGKISLRDATSLALYSVVQVPSTRSQQLIWHAGGDWLLLLNEEGVLVAVRSSLDQHVVARVNQRIVSCVTISPDGRYVVAATEDGMLAINDWSSFIESDDEPTPREIEFLTFSNSPEWALGFSWNADGTSLAILRESTRVEVWNRSGKRLSQVATIELPNAPPNNWPTDCDWFDDTLLISLSQGQLIAADGSDGRVRWTQPCLPLSRVRVQPGKRRWLTISRSASEGAVAITSLEQMSVGRAIVDTDVPIRSVVLANGGQHLITRDVDGELSSQDLKSDSVHSVVESDTGASALAASAMDSFVAATRGTQVIMLRLPELEEVARASDHSSIVWTIARSPDGTRLLSGDGNGTLNVYNVNPLRLVSSIDNLQGDVRGIAFADDGTFAVADESRIVRLYDSASRPLSSHQLQSAANTLVFGCERTLFAGDSAGTISRLTSARVKPDSWQAHRGPVWSLLRIGRRLISSGQDGAVIVWTADGEYVMTIAQLDASVWSLAYDPVHSRLFAATANGKVHMWTHGERRDNNVVSWRLHRLR